MMQTEHRHERHAGRLRRPPRFTAAMGLVTAMTMGLSLVTVQPAAADVIANESFTGVTIDQNKWYGGPYTANDPTGWACLTASTAEPKPLEGCQKHEGMPPPDKPGEGALRLTSNKTFQNGYAISKNAIPTKDGLKFTIDYAIYKPGATKVPADGIALMLLDGGAPMPVKSGKNGSGLGYVGIQGGYLGVGFDVYGNFTSVGHEAEGGLAERTPNSVTVRGAQSTKNAMIATYKSGRRWAPSGATNRQEARRTVTLELSREGMLKVLVNFHDGQPVREVIEPVDIHKIKGQPPVPENLRIGFSASTGDSTSIHELWGGKVETLGPNLSTKVEPKGTVKPGQPAEFTMTTSNDQLAGPTNGEITTTQTFPEGVKPVSAEGDGWKCTVEGQTVTCKHPGDPALKPGESLPPVTVKTEVAKDATGPKEVTSQASTPGAEPSKPVSSPFDITKGPDLTVTTTPKGQVVAGEPAEYQIDVGNKPDAGPTNGEVKVVRTFPEGIKPVSAAGQGWTCDIAGQTVTCTRPGTGDDVLQPGRNYPPISVKTDVDKGAKGQLEGTTQVTTPSSPDTTPTKDTTTVKPTPVKDPDLTVTTKPKGQVVAGEPAEYQIDVANKPDAGPTNGEVKVVRTFPEGIKPVSAEGTGWKCDIAGQTVTCTRPGTGDDVLEPGKQYPPINVKTEVDKGATGELEGTTQVTTSCACSPSTTPTKDTSTVHPAPVKVPDLTVTTKPKGEVVAGKPAAYQIDVANKPDAGPTDGEVRVVRTFPEGIKPVEAAGQGWTCDVAGQTVTCARPGVGTDVLKPGRQYPPINVKTEVDKGATGELEGTTQVTTPSSPNTTPVKDTTTVTPVKGPDLTVTTKPKGDVVAGEPAEYQIDVANKPDAGPTDGEVKVVRTFPKGIKPVAASGDGWTCTIAGQTVTCTRPGTGSDVLEPGKNYPPINVKTEVDKGATGELEGTTQVTTPGSSSTTPTTDTTTVKPAPVKEPNLSVLTKPVGDVVAGQPAKFAIGVSNAPDAGPTTGEVKVVRTFPEGIKPMNATGTGWKCAVSGQTVTCTRPDVLVPGGSYPSITVETEVDKGAKGELTGTTEAGTPGQAPKTPVKDTVSVTPASAKEPNLSVVTKPQGEVVAGKPATFHIDVSNAADAGPTHDVVTATRTFPEGVVPKVALGAGWDCKIAGQTVTCTRPGSGEDALQPGNQYPSIKVTTAVDDNASGTGEGTTGVDTKGDPDGDKPVKDTVTITPGDDSTNGGVTCYGGMARINIKPGLGIGDKLQTFTGTGTSAGCKSDGSNPAPSSVEISYTATGIGSCHPSNGIKDGKMTGVMTWYVDGKAVKSKVEGRARFAMWGADFDGVITEGKYKGMKVHGTAEWDIASTVLPGTAACLLGGQTVATGAWSHVTVSQG
ncbi:hypothetical protein P8605_17185 [Streptomyces sp. T-3]|nr:hypothetical protein [Streptomyces sp. T-3]